jgi:hypothetical protein
MCSGARFDLHDCPLFVFNKNKEEKMVHGDDAEIEVVV